MSKVVQFIKNIFSSRKSQEDFLRLTLSDGAMNSAARGSMEKRSELLRRVAR